MGRLGGDREPAKNTGFSRNHGAGMCPAGVLFGGGGGGTAGDGRRDGVQMQRI